MGPWNSDGTFGYTSVPLPAVRKAAEDLGNAALIERLSRLTHTPERSTAFLDLLQTFGSPLVTAIVAAYRECSLVSFKSSSVPAVSASAAEARPLVRTAAA